MAEPLYKDKVPAFFDDAGNPVLHLDLPFDENFNAWGDQFNALVTDQSGMKGNKEYLLTLPLDAFRDALASCTWGSMVRVWKARKEGKGEENRAQHNSPAHHGDRRREVSGNL